MSLPNCSAIFVLAAHHADADTTAVLRGWLTLVWAFLVGSATIAGVFIAVRTYIGNAWDRKVVVARLVWSEVGLHIGKTKGSRAADMGREILGSKASLIGDSADNYETKTVDGKLEPVIARDVTVHVVRIINNSPEPIGRVRLTLSGSKPFRIVGGQTVKPPKPYGWEHSPPGEVARVIRPGKERQFLVVVPVPLAETDGRKRHVTLHFTDSAGHRWRRTDTAPPKEFKPKRVRFPKLVAWKNRRVTWVRSLTQSRRG